MRLLVMMCALTSCVIELGEEPLPYSIGGFPDPPVVEPLGDPVDECILHPGPVEEWLTQDAVVLGFEAGPYWLLAYAPSPDAEGNASNAAAVPDEQELCGLAYGEGLAIPLTDDEDAEHVLLWPVSGFVADDVGYVFYRKIVIDDELPSTVLGVGVAQLGYGEAATRLVPGRYADEPTLLWKTSEAYWGRGALMHEGLAHVYGCYFDSDTRPMCHLARVAPSAIADRDAYEYFDGSGWSASPEEAAVVLRDSLASPAFNPHFGAYLHVGRGSIAVGEAPWGPFSELDEPLLLQDDWPGVQARQHPAQQSADGRSILITHRVPDFIEGAFLLRALRVELR